MNILNTLQSPADIKKLSFAQLDQLAAELRQFMLEHVSQTGGHLASNLGAVELTLAIHNIFDTSRDRLVFDVGHQSYVHKILTGRMDRFSTLRSYGGLAGFPKPSESEHDAFTGGHASSAVSTALGIARARTLRHEDYSVIAVVGDGAMTGGLFYEGMNDAGASHEPMIVILNDNGMSISRNVGGISKHLSVLRLKPGYFGLKKQYRKLTGKLPGGRKLYGFTHAVKDRLHRSLIGSTLFEEMGFLYLGPVDGHDIHKMSYLLQRAREEQRPVLLHVITKKGKGYSPAEQTPSVYHGVGCFNPAEGIRAEKENSFSAAFGACLTGLAETHSEICAITAGMPDGTGLAPFAARFPSRFFDVGIAEGHAVSMAAGLAKQGMTPVFAVYSTFLQRSYDMILQDIALQQLHVVLCVDRAGLVGADGETHHGVFDVGYLRQVPGMNILSPCNYAELRQMLREAVLELSGPVAVRYPRGGEGDYRALPSGCRLQSGSDLTLLTYGTMVNEVLGAATLLQERGISCEVLKLRTLKPLPVEEIVASVQKTGRLLVVEECNAPGSIGECVARELLSRGVYAGMRTLNLGDRYTTHGTRQLLLQKAGLDAGSIETAVLEGFHFAT
ncbi:MAG: 1-deoxy-D-xylulose-5-phosphate synthase [Oscillospiraceae bacterium]|nr:1-deoxy-D-xylulose-5-phosphate synthase [Oscillospiraceae bacterium]